MNYKKIVLVFMVIMLVHSAIALKNPSAVYCTELGYEYKVVRNSSGDRGICIMPDNSEVGAWDFLYGEVAQEYSYCKINGYEIETLIDSDLCDSVYSGKCSVCNDDGVITEVTDLMNLSFDEGVCGDGRCVLGEDIKSCPKDCHLQPLQTLTEISLTEEKAEMPDSQNPFLKDTDNDTFIEDSPSTNKLGAPDVNLSQRIRQNNVPDKESFSGWHYFVVLIIVLFCVLLLYLRRRK